MHDLIQKNCCHIRLKDDALLSLFAFFYGCGTGDLDSETIPKLAQFMSKEGLLVKEDGTEPDAEYIESWLWQFEGIAPLGDSDDFGVRVRQPRIGHSRLNGNSNSNHSNKCRVRRLDDHDFSDK